MPTFLSAADFALVDATHGFRHGSPAMPSWRAGTGTPEGVVAAPVGSLYSRTDGGTDTSVYRKETGTGATGWVAVTNSSTGGGGGGVTSVDSRTGDVVLSDLYVDITGDTMTGPLAVAAELSVDGGIFGGGDIWMGGSLIVNPGHGMNAFDWGNNGDPINVVRLDGTAVTLGQASYDANINGETITITPWDDNPVAITAGGLDLNQLELRNAVTHKLAAAPTSPVEGLRYYDTVLKVERYWDGTAWVSGGGGGGGGAVTSVDGKTGVVSLAADYVNVTGDTMSGDLSFGVSNSVKFGTDIALSRGGIEMLWVDGSLTTKYSVISSYGVQAGTDPFSGGFRHGPGGPRWLTGTGSPEGAIIGGVGSIYSRQDGGADTALYRKESGTSNTGWVAVASSSGGATGTAGGVLAGTYPNPTFAADMATQAELDAGLATKATDANVVHLAGQETITGEKSIIYGINIGTGLGPVAEGGLVRFPNNYSIAWRNAANNNNVLLGVNSSDQLAVGGSASFAGNIDLNKNELQNAVTHKLAAPPVAPVEGQRYYDTALKVEQFWNGTEWVSGGGGGGAVTSVDGQTGDVDLSSKYVDVTGDNVTGNLGLGVPSPTAKLQLASATTAAGGILFGTDVSLYRSGATALTLTASLSSYNLNSNGTMTASSYIAAGTSTLSGGFRIGASGVSWKSGTGSPEGAITAPVGSMFSRTDGGTDATLYRKETGAGNTGWVATAGGVTSVDGRTGAVVLNDLYLPLAGGAMAEGGNIGLGTTTGTKIGTTATQKIGFWNATPVVQSVGWGITPGYSASKAYNPQSTTLTAVANTLGTLIDTLKACGLLG